jgi:hypothetical protein
MPSAASEAWIRTLTRRLNKRAIEIRKWDRYYRGDQPLAYAGKKFREAFGQLFTGFSDNFLALVVDAVEERLTVEGFRIGAGADPLEARRADDDARRIWQENQLDAESSIGHVEALVKGIAYTLVWPTEDDVPRITIEDPLEAITASAPGDRRQVVAGLKRWRDDEGHHQVTLYLPDRVEKYRSEHPIGKPGEIELELDKDLDAADTTGNKPRWLERRVTGETWPLENPMGRVPLTPLINRPRLDGTGRSEIADVIPMQDAINLTWAQALVAGEFASFRQRWATGMEIPEDEDGKPIEPFKAAVDRLWIAEDQTTKFGEFEATDLRPYIATLEALVQHIATRTRTPAHYLLGQAGSFPSGESLKATETGLVAKTRRAMKHLGEGWEATMRLAFLAVSASDPRGREQDTETIWTNPESRTESEHTDAVIKLKALNVPDEFLWELYGFTQNQIARLLAMREREELEAEASRAAAPTPPEQPPEPGAEETLPPTALPAA